MILLSSTLKSMDEDQLVIENENVKNKKVIALIVEETEAYVQQVITKHPPK